MRNARRPLREGTALFVRPRLQSSLSTSVRRPLRTFKHTITGECLFTSPLRLRRCGPRGLSTAAGPCLAPLRQPTRESLAAHPISFNIPEFSIPITIEFQNRTHTSSKKTTPAAYWTPGRHPPESAFPIRPLPYVLVGRASHLLLDTEHLA